MIIEVGNQYGNSEVISINPGKVNFMCICGTPFSSPVDIVRRQGAPRACPECIKTRISMMGIGCSSNAKVDADITRDYTSKEAQMIKDFENGK